MSIQCISTVHFPVSPRLIRCSVDRSPRIRDCALPTARGTAGWHDKLKQATPCSNDAVNHTLVPSSTMFLKKIGERNSAFDYGGFILINKLPQ